MFRFEHTNYLFALVLIPLLLAVWLLMRRWRKKALSTFASENVIDRLIPDISESRAKWKIFLQLGAFFFMVIAIANPQFGSKLEEVKREGIDLMIALDVSNSMNAEDITPSRMERAKQMLLKLIDNLNGDRIGIVIFAGEAFVQLPITTDYAAAKLFVNTINTDAILTQGTAITPAIQLAIKSLESKKEKSSKVILVITDGEDHEGEAIQAIEEAASKGIIIHAAGIGSVQGSPIPIYRNGQQVGFKKDKEGNTVITQLNEGMLRQMAAAGKGSYIRIENSQGGLNAIISQLDKLEKAELSSKEFTEYESRFQYFIAAALLLLTIDFFLSRRKSKWFRNVNLFEEHKK